MGYSKELKDSIILKMLPPDNQSISQIQQESGIPEGTLKQWRRKIRVRDSRLQQASNKAIDGVPGTSIS